MTTKAKDVRAMAKAHRENGWPHTDTAEVLEACADLIDQLAKGEPVAWGLRFWGITRPDELGPFNTATTFSSKKRADQYADACAKPDACDHNPKRLVVVPLYTHPSPTQAEPVK
jgi:hypothetical protein